MHVDAKRYLCAIEPGYRETLSPPSLVSLALQGGPMTRGEIQAFRGSPHAAAAIALRRWDDAAKDPTLAVAGVDEYIPFIEEALAPGAAAAQSAR
jgi:gamma-butyrobetaine dioxygenase